MKHLSSDRGIVSLLTSVLMSLLFVIVVVAMVSVITRQQSQSANADESTRAFYAAEAGVEDGLSLVKNALADPNNPQAALAAAEDGGNCHVQAHSTTNASYTCMVLSRRSTKLSGDLQPDISTGEQIDLSGLSNIGRIVISWNLPGIDADLTNLANLPQIFANGGTWGDNPAVVEMTTVRFAPNVMGNFDPTDPNQLNLIENIIVPSDGTPAGAGNVPDYANNTSAQGSTNNYNPDFGVCSVTAAPYNCTISLTVKDSSVFRHVLRLRSRYKSAHYSIQVYDTSGNRLTVPDQSESIDVTAKAGSTTRRVRAKVAIIQNSAALDYALFSDDDICKDFQLRESQSGGSGSSSGICPF